jgi:sulfite reductase (ferredoxin)
MTTTTKPAKETTAQRVERLKRAKNPWESLKEIRQFAREGWDSIPPEWIGTYFRWWGVYTQGDGAGVTGGQGGVGRALQRFMVRIRIPNGMMTSHQLRTIADLTRRHANGIADLTVRQNIQLHWVTIESLPEVLDGLWQVGLNTTGACGDVVRNVTGCPLAGVDADEIIDASPLVLETSRFLAGNAEFYNLPRKFKISIAGCHSWCSYPEINDIGLTAITRTVNGKPEVGFSLRVAGGLSTEPYLGARLNAFVQWNQVVPVIKGVAELFRDSEVLREHRERARLKFLFLRHGWTAERFLDELQQRIGFRLDSAVEEHPPDDVYRDHVGIHAQKQPGLSYVGAVVLRGRITADQMQSAADLAGRFAGGELRATNMQNLLVVNVPTVNADPLARELDAIGLKVGGSSF